MKLEQSFEVSAPVDQVWEALIDIERVVPCLPGAAVTGRGQEEGSYDGTFSVKIGPTTASYAGRLSLENVDESAHTATMQANGTDRRGQGGARASIVSTLDAIDGRTRVEVDTDYQITGRLARFGRGGMIEDIAERLLTEFAQRLQESLAGEDGEQTSAAAGVEGTSEAPAALAGDEPPSPTSTTTAAEAPRPAPTPVQPLEGGSLIASVIWDRARRNPPALVAVLAGVGDALLVL